MTWSTNDDKVIVYVRGAQREVRRTDNFVETIRDAAAACGLRTFTVQVTYADGHVSEVDSPEDAPATFEGIHSVEVNAYNKAG